MNRNTVEMGPSAVAVVGMSARVPGAGDVAAFWRNLCAGVESIAALAGEDLAAAGVDPELAEDAAYVRAAGLVEGHDLFDAAFFGYSPREAELMDPQQRLFLEECWKALEDAACDPRRFAGRIGVYAGAGLNRYLLDHVYPRRDLLAAAGEYQAALANDKDFLATRVSYKLDLRGPSVTVQTACSTSLVAVCLACQSLVSGECDAALAGGVTLRLPHRAGYLYEPEGILSPDGHCRAFDAAAAGTVPGSGVGVVALRRLADALADGDPVRAVIRGWALNNDGGEKAGYTAPRKEGQEEAILEALALAEVDPATVTCVEAHGTGTRLGDPIEVAALKAAFAAGTAEGAVAKGYCALGSVKTNIGHLDDAAGVAGLIKTVLALEHRRIPASLHFTEPNPELGLDDSPFYVNDRLRDWTTDGAPRRAGVSSFGIGGTNAHVVLEEAPPAAPAEPRDGAEADGERYLLVLSARTETALAAASSDLARHFAEHPELEPAAVERTLARGRRALEHRRAVVCRNLEDAATALSAPEAAVAAPWRLASGVAEAGHRPVAFLFPGQGAQYAGMAAGLYRRLPVFRRELDRAAGLLAPELGRDLRDVLFPAADPDEADERLRRTELTQPSVFAVSYALACQWRAWGVEPEALLGHSVGEYVAACLAGVFELADALAVVAARGRLLGRLEGGAMLSVALAEERLVPLLDGGLELAALNAPAVCTVAGPAEAAAELERRLADEGVESRRLQTSHAFHTAAVEPLLAPFREVVGRVRLAAPAVPFMSNVTGTWIRDEEATDPEYWVRHLRRTVRFAPAARELLSEPARVFLEVGPGEVTATLLRQNLTGPAAGRTIVSSLRHPRDPSSDLEVLLDAAARLWLAGVPVDFADLHGEGRRVPLPTYPFEGRRHWVEPSAAATGTAAPAAVTKRADMASWFYVPSWKRTLAPGVPATGLPAAGGEDTEEDAGAWLVFLDGDGLGRPWTEHWERRGRRVVTVEPGVGFERRGATSYAFDPDALDGYETLIGELGLAKAAWQGIVYLPVLRRGPDAPASGSGPAPELDRFLYLVQALGRHLHRRSLPLVLVANGLFEVVGGDAFAPERAALAGFAKVVPQEYPHLRCRVVDLDAGAGTAGEVLLAELESESAEPVVAYRGRHRWTRTFEPVRADAPAASFLHPGGHYLITGGLGRFGLDLARHLASAAGAKLTLLDRRTPDDEATRAALDEVREAAAGLAVERVDVADAERTAAVLRAAVDELGPLAGVVHAAGAPVGAYRTIAELTPADLAEHLAPKGVGARALGRAFDEALAPGERPGFVLATSSLSSILGGIGLAAFAAADGWLDGFAELHDGWTSVNWEAWQEAWEGDGGATLGSGQNALALEPDEIAGAFERVLAFMPQSRLAVATGDLVARLEQWTSVLEGSPESAAHLHRDSDAPYEAPSSPVEAKVAELWQLVLGVDRVGVHDDFFLLGGSSLSGLRILSELRREFDVELPLRSFFEARTVAAMAELIAAEQRKSEEDEDRLAAILAEIESLSEDEVDQELRASTRSEL